MQPAEIQSTQQIRQSLYIRFSNYFTRWTGTHTHTHTSLVTWRVRTWETHLMRPMIHAECGEILLVWIPNEGGQTTPTITRDDKVRIILWNESSIKGLSDKLKKTYLRNMNWIDALQSDLTVTQRDSATRESVLEQIGILLPAQRFCDPIILSVRDTWKLRTNTKALQSLPPKFWIAPGGKLGTC